MATIKIVTDSTADISREEAEALGIEVVPLQVQFGEQIYRCGVDLTNEQFYTLLEQRTVLPRTIAPSPMMFEQIYRRLAPEYDYVFSIHLSSRLGETYRSAVQARAKLPASLTRVEVIDSKLASMGLGAVVLTAASAAADGATPDEVSRLINAMIQHTHVVFFVDSLEHLEQGGRLAMATTVLGSMQRIKPLLILDEGEIVPYERTRTRAKAIEGLYTFVEDFPHVEEVAVLYATNDEDVGKLLEKVDLIFPRDRVKVVQFGPAVATHLGPGAMGVVVFEGIE